MATSQEPSPAPTATGTGQKRPRQSAGPSTAAAATALAAGASSTLVGGIVAGGHPSSTVTGTTGGNGTGNASAAPTPPAPQPRAKRRKPEASSSSTAQDGPNEDRRDRAGRPVPFGVGMVKGREEEWTEPADIKTKIDFIDLPVETLYRYLEIHDLLPRWDVSPWSEEQCTPPNALYAIPPPPPPVVPVVPSPKKADTPLETPLPVVEDAAAPHPLPVPDETATVDSNGVSTAPTAPTASALTEDGTADVGTTAGVDPVAGDENVAGSGGAGVVAGGDDGTPAPPTTRSKTAPFRKPPTPEPSPAVPEIRRGVMTLSDVHAARAILAEKANAHWIKGLGGGQNREAETIVNFLYKNKVGHGRLLRVYNPAPAPFY